MLYEVITPVNWKQGEDVIIVPAVSDEEAKQKFPGARAGVDRLREHILRADLSITARSLPDRKR